MAPPFLHGQPLPDLDHQDGDQDRDQAQHRHVERVHELLGAAAHPSQHHLELRQVGDHPPEAARQRPHPQGEDRQSHEPAGDTRAVQPPGERDRRPQAPGRPGRAGAHGIHPRAVVPPRLEGERARHERGREQQGQEKDPPALVRVGAGQRHPLHGRGPAQELRRRAVRRRVGDRPQQVGRREDGQAQAPGGAGARGQLGGDRPDPDEDGAGERGAGAERQGPGRRGTDADHPRRHQHPEDGHGGQTHDHGGGQRGRPVHDAGAQQLGAALLLVGPGDPHHAEDGHQPGQGGQEGAHPPDGEAPRRGQVVGRTEHRPHGGVGGHHVQGAGAGQAADDRLVGGGGGRGEHGQAEDPGQVEPPAAPQRQRDEDAGAGHRPVPS